ncbi:hypothetical protein QBC40DRAFT_284618 [Triangularia verruculosa]|uniref:Secreted protein n=1 Tax=Triangularia verruculosa TaxID=2587418 RepID=A0AAN7ASN2_9PEZI|nr:hypothetical protein QBC40DRAFT_284618 [Triangularia verruculosa]
MSFPSLWPLLPLLAPICCFMLRTGARHPQTFWVSFSGHRRNCSQQAAICDRRCNIVRVEGDEEVQKRVRRSSV